MGLDITLNQLPSLGIHGHSTGAIDHAIADDGLRIDAGERFGRLICEDGGFGGHFGCEDVIERR